MKTASWLLMTALRAACGPALASREFRDDRGRRVAVVYAIDPDALDGFGPRALQAAREMCAYVSQARTALAAFR